MSRNANNDALQCALYDGLAFGEFANEYGRVNDRGVLTTSPPAFWMTDAKRGIWVCKVLPGAGSSPAPSFKSTNAMCAGYTAYTT